MIKAASAAIALMAIAAPAAMADGFYVNPEYNLGFSGNQTSGGGAIDAHVGYEAGPWYIQGGPALVSVDGEDVETEFSGKVGADVDLTEQLALYGEFSFITGDDDTGYGTKVGVTYSF